MPNVVATVKRFNGDYASINGEHRLKVSRRAILGAALTLGFQDFGDLRSASAREWSRRLADGVKALSSLAWSVDGVTTEPGYEDLDMSEMGAQTYSLGMIFAKIAADRLLKVPWLAHVDEMREKGLLVTDPKSKERGDMVGLCREMRWHVVEAKGRSSPYTDKLVQKAKDQSARVTEVGGVSPSTTSACITSLWTNPIHVLLDDPQPDGDETWQIDADRFWRHYYGRLAGYIKEGESPLKVKALDSRYSFAPLAPVLETFPPSLRDALSPLPEYVGLPHGIIEDPGAGWVLLKESPARGIAEGGSDGLVLWGPFGVDEKRKFGRSEL
jgi:hypothetical protein